jgi:hypothetical protein
MVTVASQPPVRSTSGGTPDAVFQPLADCGAGNPFFYHTFADDFDINGKVLTNAYTVTTTGTGAAVASTPGDGGLILFTAPTAAGNASIQLASASFTVNTLPKKVFFETRVKMSAWATAGVTALWGLIQTTATPGTVTDGVYFALTAAGVLSINSMVGSVLTTAVIPAAAYTLTANVNVDLAFEITRQGDVLAYVDSQLVGYVPPSNIGTTNGPQNAGAVARLTAPTLTAVVLNPTLAIIQTVATAITMTVDFFQAQKER